MTATFDRISRDPGFRELFRVAHQRRWQPDEPILSESTPTGNLFLLMVGVVSVRSTAASAKELLLAYLYPGDFFGEMCLFQDVTARSATIRARDESTTLEIAPQAFVELSRKHPSLWLELAGQIAARLRSTNRRLAQLPVLNAPDRIWLLIQEMVSHVAPQGIPPARTLRITREDLGRFAGCTREVAGLVLQDLAATGRIVLAGQSIVVPESRLCDANT